MQISLTLNPETTAPFFFITEAEVNLNYQEPGPAIVEWGKASTAVKSQIINAIQRRIILSSEPIEKLLPKKVKPPVLPATDKKSVPPKSQAPVANEGMDTAVSRLLHKSLAGLKKAISKSQDIRLLRLTKDIEVQKKNRKSVIVVLDKRILHLEGLVANAIATTSPGLPYNDGLGLSSSVVETPHKTLELKMKPGVPEIK